MALIDTWKLVQHKTLHHRIEVAAVTAAITVANEDPQTANHAERKALALKVMAAPETYANIMAIGVCSNVTIAASGAASTDNDIQYVVNSLWDTYALAGV